MTAAELARFRQLFRNRVHDTILSLFLELHATQRLSQKAIAGQLGLDPSRINRLLANPANITLDTVSDLLLAMNAIPVFDAEHSADPVTREVWPTATDLLQGDRTENPWVQISDGSLKSPLPSRDNQPANDDQFSRGSTNVGR